MRAATLIAGLGASLWLGFGEPERAEADPPAMLVAVSSAPTPVTQGAAARNTRLPALRAEDLVIVPPREPNRRVFEALRVEPWMRGGRVGVRMSASF